MCGNPNDSDSCYLFEISDGDYPSEVTWEVMDSGGDLLLSGSGGLSSTSICADLRTYASRPRMATALGFHLHRHRSHRRSQHR